jgi:hypothetical protein
MRTKKLLIVSIALLAGALVGSATADTVRFTDPNDTPGRLDVKAVRHAHDGARLLHTVRTYKGWDSNSLAGDENYIGFYLDAGDESSEADRFIWVRHKEGRGLYAEIFRPGVHANGERLGPVRVSRPDRHSVRIAPRLSQLSKGIRNGYTWRVTTSFEKSTTGGPCGRDNEVSSFSTGRCVDNVPGVRKDGFAHEL